MSSSSKTLDIPRATIYLYDINKEVDLIDLEDEEDKLRKIKVNTRTVPMEVNIKFEDLIGDQQVNFIENKLKGVPRKHNVMDYIEVMDYVDQRNQNHAMLMHQVAETKQHCRKQFNEQVDLLKLSSSPLTSDIPEAIIHEVDLIDLKNEQDKPRKIKVSTKTDPMKVNIKFEHLIGDKQVHFIENKPKPVLKAGNVHEYIEVMDYIDKSSQQHALLMYQLAETNIQCRKLLYQYM